MNIYIHIPFCAKKCNYCTLYSVENTNSVKIDEYLDYLEREFFLKLKIFPLFKKGRPESISIGGGTPNCLSDEQLVRLFKILRDRYDLNSVTDFNVELNPALCDIGQLKIFKTNNVRRLSFGIQSVDEKVLRATGRFYAKNQKIIILEALKMGFEVNLDFIYGFPGQTLGNIVNYLELIKEIHPTSVTLFDLNLTEEQVHLKYYQKIKSQRNDFKKGLYLKLKNGIIEMGYQRLTYEYFSLDERMPFSVPTSNIMNETMIGFGPFSVSRIGSVLMKNQNNLNVYCACLDNGRLPIEEIYRLEKIEDFILKFFSIEVAKIKFMKLSLEMAEILKKELGIFLKYGYLIKSGSTLKLTEKGIDNIVVLNGILFKNHQNLERKISEFGR